MHGSDDGDGKDLSEGLKLYQTRLQDLLYKHLDKTFGATAGDHSIAPAKSQQPSSKNDVVDGGERTGGIRLFRRAPPGIVVQPREERMLGPGIKPQLRPSLTVGEDSEEHLVRLQATVVDSETVAEQAKRLREKVLASSKSSQVLSLDVCLDPTGCTSYMLANLFTCILVHVTNYMLAKFREDEWTVKRFRTM